MLHLFKYNSGKTDGSYLDGESISGYDKLTWVERYDEPGEVTIEAPLRSGLLETLPMGTIIGHQDSLDLMIIDTVKLVETGDAEPRITLEGPNLFGFLEEREVGVRRAQTNETQDDGYVTTNDSWNAIRDLINDHISATAIGGKSVNEADDALPGVICEVVATGLLPGLTSDSERRTYKDKSLKACVEELLGVSGIGIRCVRPNSNPNNPANASHLTKIQFLVHAGQDKSQEVIFSRQLGDFVDAEYLWSERTRKTTVVSSSQYLNRVDHIIAAIGWFRRMKLNRCIDIDQHLDVIPVAGATRDAYLNAMSARATQVGKKSLGIDITQVDILPDARYRFRKDYDLGDLVGVQGTHGGVSIMRVTENAEIYDEGKFSSTPSLKLEVEDE